MESRTRSGDARASRRFFACGISDTAAALTAHRRGTRSCVRTYVRYLPQIHYYTVCTLVIVHNLCTGCRRSPLQERPSFINLASTCIIKPKASSIPEVPGRVILRAPDGILSITFMRETVTSHLVAYSIHQHPYTLQGLLQNARAFTQKSCRYSC